MAAPGTAVASPDAGLLSALGRAGDPGAQAHYADPAYYTKTYAARREDVDYYVELARECGGPVLEYGVGNGRIAIPIARAGLTVHGVDLSSAMLVSLQRRLLRQSAATRARVTFTHGDMRAVRLRQRFPLVIAPFNTFLHLYERADVERFLARVREHLAPRARFVFDCSIPRVEDLARQPDRRYAAPRLRHPTTGQLVRYAERFEYDPLRQLMLVRMEFVPEDGSPPWMVPLTHRQFFPEELRALLHYNGFEDLVLTADFTAASPGPEVDSLVVSVRARTRRATTPGRHRPPIASRRRTP